MVRPYEAPPWFHQMSRSHIILYLNSRPHTQQQMIILGLLNVSIKKQDQGVEFVVWGLSGRICQLRYQKTNHLFRSITFSHPSKNRSWVFDKDSCSRVMAGPES